MKRIINITFSVISWVLLLQGCTSEPRQKSDIPGDVPVILGSIGTRTGDLGEATINLIARDDLDTTKLYIDETPVYCAGGLDNTVKELTFTDGTPYYPLGGYTIRFFAYTGTAPDGYMTLTAGKLDENDAVLSNYGRRKSDGSVNRAYEGLGTPGSSTIPAALLQFRHVMTQLIVTVKVDPDEVPIVDPAPQKVEFEMSQIPATGKYPIWAPEPDPNDEASAIKASNLSGNYTVTLGTNYLIPTGADLTGEGFTSLIIDDYEATDADLLGFTLSPGSSNTSTLLLPGYSYEMVITVKKLRVTDVTITPQRWVFRELEESNPSFEPNSLSIDFTGGYSNTGDDAITKVVLHTLDNKLYVGEPDTPGNDIQFVILPQSNVDTIRLFTAKGLLLETPITSEYNYLTHTLSLPISKGGMLPENPSAPYGQNNPYLITTPVQLLNIEKELDGFYKQDVNLDLSDLILDPDIPFTGFGPFSGIYDGNGFWIADMNITGSGMFSENDGGTLTGIRLYSGVIDATGQPYAGTLCGLNNGLIEGCINEAITIKSTTTVGGITGHNGSNGRIVATLNTGNMRQGNIIGGICGYNENTDEAAITGCVNTGMLYNQASLLGGIIGQSEPSSNNVVRTCFWLVGTAQSHVGGGELAVASDNVETVNTSDLDPYRMRNGLAEGEQNSDKTVNRLNAEIELTYPTIYNEYWYVLSPVVTGLTWPAPVKRSNP